MLRQAPSRRSQYPLDIESLSDVRQLLISFSLKHTIINFIHSMNTKHFFITPSLCHNYNVSHAGMGHAFLRNTAAWLWW